MRTAEFCSAQRVFADKLARQNDSDFTLTHGCQLIPKIASSTGTSPNTGTFQ